MTQATYGTPKQRELGPYDFLLKIVHTFEKIPLEEIVKIDPLGTKFVQDGKTLEATASEQAYLGIESNLVDHLRGFRSGQSYGNVALNEVGDRFLSILVDYLGLIDKKFKTCPKKMERIRFAIIRTFREKVGNGAWRYIPDAYIGLYKRAEQDVLKEKPEAKAQD